MPIPKDNPSASRDDSSPAPTESHGPGARRKSPTKTAGKSIVFAESDEDLRETVGKLLEGRGYKVHPARDGLECLLAIRSIHPSFAILDIVMPKIDGGRVCWLVRQDRSLRHTPIIAFSGLGPKDIQRFPELSADAYVAKGPMAVVGQSILQALEYLEGHGHRNLTGGIFGYEGFRPRKLTSEMLLLRRHYDGFMRAFGCGVMELDPGGHILVANALAVEMAGRREYRLIGEVLPSLFPGRTRQRLVELLRELAQARLPEERRVSAPLGGREVTLRFFTTVDSGQCIGILVTLESRAPGPRT